MRNRSLIMSLPRARGPVRGHRPVPLNLDEIIHHFAYTEDGALRKRSAKSIQLLLKTPRLITTDLAELNTDEPLPDLDGWSEVSKHRRAFIERNIDQYHYKLKLDHDTGIRHSFTIPINDLKNAIALAKKWLSHTL